MIDKYYCMSSFLTFRCIIDDDKEFKEGMHHSKYIEYPMALKIPVKTSDEMAAAYENILRKAQEESKVGLLLSGGMDSACLASFLKPGTDAYTFRFLNGTFGKDELSRAEYYAKKYRLNLHYVEINFDIVKRNLPLLMIKKGAPVHSIEPQIMEAALYAKRDGVEQLICADNSDAAFGGYDKMLSKDWNYDDWKSFYTFLDPSLVLKNPVSMDSIFSKYKVGNNKVDYIRFISEVFAPESCASYQNAVLTSGLKFQPILDPTDMVYMKEPLDLERIRNGESKYLVRELFKRCYPELSIPEKVPMPRPVDYYFKDWSGPKRPEFKENIDMKTLSGNQKWLLYCLELFLNLFSL